MVDTVLQTNKQNKTFYFVKCKFYIFRQCIGYIVLHNRSLSIMATRFITFNKSFLEKQVHLSTLLQTPFYEQYLPTYLPSYLDFQHSIKFFLYVQPTYTLLFLRYKLCDNRRLATRSLTYVGRQIGTRLYEEYLIQTSPYGVHYSYEIGRTLYP